MNKKLIDKIKVALDQDPSIVVSKEQLQKYKGYSIDHYNALGITKLDLKQLERHGLAVRGYVREEVTTALGKKQSTTRTRWLLIGDFYDSTV